MWIFLNPQLFLSGYSFLLLASGEFGNQSGIFLNQPSRLEKINPPITCERVNPDIFESNMAAQRVRPVSVEWIRIPSDACRRANSILIRCVWTEKCLKSGKKKLRIHKYPDTHGRGLRIRTILPLPLLDYTTAIYICNKTNIYGSYIITLSGIVAHFRTKMENLAKMYFSPLK